MIRGPKRFGSDLLSLIVGGLLLALSSTVLIGWYTHTIRLIQVSPEFAPMQINTALCFLLSGIAILILNYAPRISGLLGGLVLAFSFFTLFQDIFSVNFGIDTLFTQPYVHTRTFHPGRMAPNTAFAFCLSGLMFLFNGFLRSKKFFNQATLILPIMIFIVAFVAFLGYVTNVSSVYAWGPFSGMALHTSCGFILLSLPSFSRIYHEIKNSIKTNSYFLGAVIFSSGLTLFLILTQVIMSKTEAYFIEKIKRDAGLISEKMLVLMKEDYEAVERLFFRLDFNSYRSNEAIKYDAEMYIRQMPELAILLIHGTGKSSEPLILSQKNIDLIKQRKLIMGCQKNLKHGSAMLSSKTTIFISGRVLCVEDSTSKNLAILDLSHVISSLLGESYIQKYYAELLSGQEKIYQSLPYFNTLSPNFFYSNPFYFNHIALKLNLYLKNFSYLEIYGWLIFLFFYSGVFLSALIAVAIHLWQGVRLSARRLEGALAEKLESEEILKHIVSSSPGAILIVKKNDTLSFFNEKALVLWGYSSEEFSQKSIGDLMPERFREAHYEFRQKYYKNPKLVPLGSRKDQCILNKSGDEVPVEIELNPMTVKGEVRILCTFMDVSQRKKDEAQIKKYTEDLKSSNEALRDFAYIASHDLKEPLRGISNFSAFLLEDYGNQLDQAGKDKLQTLQRLAKRMGDLIDTLLLYSRVGSLDLRKRTSKYIFQA